MSLKNESLTVRLLAFFAVLLLVAGCSSIDSTPEEVSSSVDANTDAVSASVPTTIPAVTPVATPVPPTPIPEPTATPVPQTPTPEPTSTPFPVIEQVIHPDCVGVQNFDGGLPSESDYCSVNKILQDRPGDQLECGRLDIDADMKAAWPDNAWMNKVGHRLTFKHDCAISNSGAPRPFRVFDSESEIDLPTSVNFELGQILADANGVNNIELIDFMLETEWCNPLIPEAVCISDLVPEQIGTDYCAIQFRRKSDGTIGIWTFDITFVSISTGTPQTLFSSVPPGAHNRILYGIDVPELGETQDSSAAGWGAFPWNTRTGEFSGRAYFDDRPGRCSELS